MSYMLGCLFGHKIENDVCIKCGKTICEIKGHEWIYSNYKNHTHSGNQSKRRTCVKCNIVEDVTAIYISYDGSVEGKCWERRA